MMKVKIFAARETNPHHAANEVSRQIEDWQNDGTIVQSVQTQTVYDDDNRCTIIATVLFEELVPARP